MQKKASRCFQALVQFSSSEIFSFLTDLLGLAIYALAYLSEESRRALLISHLKKKKKKDLRTTEFIVIVLRIIHQQLGMEVLTVLFSEKKAAEVVGKNMGFWRILV